VQGDKHGFSFSFLQADTQILTFVEEAVFSLLYIFGTFVNPIFLSTVVLQYLEGIGSRISMDTKIGRCSNLLYKMVRNLHITCSHPLVYVKSSLDYL
jgi:hypothetical protein